MTSSARIAVLLCALATACGDGTVVDLGDARPPLYHFGAPRMLAELDVTFPNENPTLTADLLDLVFTSNRGINGSDVWMAHRASPADPFGAPVRVDEVSSAAFETSAAIALDGLSLYVGSDRPGGLGDLDIWASTRATRDARWSAPANLIDLNTIAKDVPRAPGQHDLVMPLSSDRGSPTVYQTFLAARPSATGAFGPPALVAELAAADHSIVDAFLSDDGLTLFYTSALGTDKPDLYVAWRKTVAQPFSVWVPLDDLNSAADERDPWLSPDGKTLYFTSDRSGTLEIYEASVTRGPSAGK